jgi:hypothetical protein
MSKIGINISIDVTKIDKSRLFKGKKGTYMDVTTFIDTDNPDQYEQHGFISQSTNKEEREAGVKTPILGNCKVFFNSAEQSTPKPNAEQGTPFDDAIPNDDLDSIPF